MKKVYAQPEFVKTRFVLTETIAKGSEGNPHDQTIECQSDSSNQRNHVYPIWPYNCGGAPVDPES